MIAALATSAVAQAALWHWLYAERGPLVASAVRWLGRRPTRAAAVVANARPQFSTYGIEAESDLVELWSSANLMVPLHHGLATLFALLALQTTGPPDWSAPTLIRAALSFEIGEDLLHYLQMVWTALRPERGVSPWRFMGRGTWAFIIVHHSLGLVAGSGAFLSDMSTWPEFHRCVFLLLFASLPCYLKSPLQMVADLSKPSLLGALGAAIDVGGLLVMIWVRLVEYLPMAIPLCARARAEFGPGAGALCEVPALYVFPLFNLASVVFFVPYVWARVREQLGGGTAATGAAKKRA